jgi:hypothetical protein
MPEQFDNDLLKYLKEFESAISFDGEICPKCGLDFTKDQLKIAKWVKYRDDLIFSELERIAEILDEEKVHYYFSKNEDIDGPNRYYLLVLNDSVEKVGTLLSPYSH